MKYADLHVHTYYSDSTFSPEEVVTCARDKALSAVAICDHDCVDGIDPCIELGGPMGVEIVPGIELTVERPAAEIHILGYFIDYRQDWFLSKLRAIRQSRVDRIHKMVGKLSEMNVKINAEDVFKLAGKGSVGRLHLAQAMLKAGVIKSIREAFDKYIGYLESCYVTKLNFTPEEAISSILKLGGVPVLAHPNVLGRDEYIPGLIACGLKGIEVYHSDHKNEAVRKYERIAEENALLMTGGSDCHGMGKGRILLGRVRIPYTVVENLRRKSEDIRRGNG